MITASGTYTIDSTTPSLWTNVNIEPFGDAYKFRIMATDYDSWAIIYTCNDDVQSLVPNGDDANVMVLTREVKDKKAEKKAKKEFKDDMFFEIKNWRQLWKIKQKKCQYNTDQ